MLTGLIRQATGSPPELLRRIVEGYENEVHRIRCADGQDVVIRILRWGGDSTRSAGEAWAMEQARAAGVPVPEILLHGTVRIDGAVFPVMVQRAVPGRPGRGIVIRTIGAGVEAADPVPVSGIGDFGDWKPGAPVHDLAVLRVRGPHLELRPILTGYGAPDDTTYRRRLDLHTLAVALPSLSTGVGEDDHAGIERVGTLVRLLLQDLADSGSSRPEGRQPGATNR